MKIAVLSYGSRGDAQPPMVLAYHLAQAGHDVRLALPGDFSGAASALGCSNFAFPFAARAVMTEGQLTTSIRRGRTVAFFREAMQLDLARREAMATAVISASADADLLILPALLEDMGLSVAERHGQRVALAFPSPLWANSTYPHLLFSGWGLPRWLNRFTHTITELGARALIPIINDLRAHLGLTKVRRRPSLAFRRVDPPVFYWVPEKVLPRPKEYGGNHHFTGYWGAPPAVRAALGESRPPEALVRFLAAGPPPLFVGFGSMPVFEPHIIDAVMQATQRLGLRVVYGSGWSDLEVEESAQAIMVGDVDHEWLFPQCAAVVHHGGASTTGAAIRAGVPAVVASVFADQPFWGQRVAALGVGETFRFQHMTAERLQRAVGKAMSTVTAAAATALAQQLGASEDGAVTAARMITEDGETYPIPARLA